MAGCGVQPFVILLRSLLPLSSRPESSGQYCLTSAPGSLCESFMFMRRMVMMADGVMAVVTVLRECWGYRCHGKEGEAKNDNTYFYHGFSYQFILFLLEVLYLNTHPFCLQDLPMFDYASRHN
jgi:hypothetical protein